MTSEDDEQELDAEQLNQLIESDRQVLEQANKTITNLLRKEPILYLEVAQNALIRTLEVEKVRLDGKNRDLKDRLDAVRQLVRQAEHGDLLDSLMLIAKLNDILGDD